MSKSTVKYSNVFAVAFTLICFIIQVIPTTETSSIQNLVSEIAYRVAVSNYLPNRLPEQAQLSIFAPIGGYSENRPRIL